MPVERQRGLPTPTVAHEGNPRMNSLVVSGTLDGEAFITFAAPPFLTLPAPPDNTTPPADGDCPECMSGQLNLSIVCCSIQGGATCELTCDTPVLVKACGGTPPYLIYTDEEFLHAAQILDDEAIISIRKKYVQFRYRLRSDYWSSNPCGGASNHPGRIITEMWIRQENQTYDCNMEVVGDAYCDDTMVMDTPAC